MIISDLSSFKNLHSSICHSDTSLQLCAVASLAHVLEGDLFSAQYNALVFSLLYSLKTLEAMLEIPKTKHLITVASFC